MRHHIITGIVVAAGCCTPAAAQTANAPAPRATYPAAFFADAQAQNALDMLARVPGFTLTESDTVRGFGDAAGNVLVNGARPATKDISLSDVLRRIPASTVERIDLLDGAATGLQGGGSRLVANIILKSSTTSGGTFRLRGETTGGDRFGPFAAASWNGLLSGATLSASLEGGFSSLNVLTGRERLIDSRNIVVEEGPLIDRRQNTRYAGTLSIAAPVGGIDATLATSLQSTNFRRNARVDILTFNSISLERSKIESDDYPSRSVEFSLELKRMVGRGEAKLIGLQTLSRNEGLSQVGAEFPTGAFSRSRFRSIENQSESILRATWA